MNYRVIFSDNGTLNDLSVNLNNYHSGTGSIGVVATQDYIYIGSRYPFNSFYMAFGTANTQASTLSIDYWDGSSWQSAVDVIDQTSGFQQDGLITFVPDKGESGWVLEDTVDRSGNEMVTGLGDVTIYDQYWLRLSLSANLDAGTTIKWVMYKFMVDDDLYSEYPIFNSSTLKDAYESGKTDWEEQIIVGSKLVVDELVRRGLIQSGNQLLDYSKLESPTVPKVAELIFNALGDDYENDRLKARDVFKERSGNKIFNIDLNNNATLDNREIGVRSGHFWR